MITRRLQMGLWAAAALTLGVALRLWFIFHAAQVNGDSLIYGDIAKNWMQHGVYGFALAKSVPVPTLIRLPGYPLFLMACFRLFGVEHYTAVMYVQCAIDLATCLLIAALAGRLFGRRAALAALWLSALCPFTAGYVASPLTETPSLACIALAFYGLEHWRAAGLGLNRWLWITSAALAYAVLLRPEQGLLAAAVIPAMLWMVLRSRNQTTQAADEPTGSPLQGERKASQAAEKLPVFAFWIKRGASAPRKSQQTQGALAPGLFTVVRPVLLAAVCVVLPLAPWALRNWRTFHVFQPLAPRYATDPGEKVPLGFQRWYRSWGIDFASTNEVYWNYDDADINIADIPSRAFDSEEQYTRTAALFAEYNQTDGATPAFDARFEALAKERIQADPLRYYVALPMARLANMFLRPRTEMLPVSLDWWNWREHPQESAFDAAYAGLNLAYLVLGGAGLWLWWRRRWDGNPELAWAMLGFVLLRCAMLLTLDNSEPRYTLEFFPVTLVWSAALFARRSKESGL